MLSSQLVYSSNGGGAMPRSIFDYEVIDFIGEGAGSLIYVVSHPDSRQLYALKHVRRRRDKDVRFFEQLANEFEVGGQFTHRALRRSIELRDNHTLFRKPTEAALIMELFDGAPLDARSPADLLGVLQCFIQVAQGLAALHAMGYAHCDLKPGNILVNAEGLVKIIDFGQTCRLGSVKQRIQGTPEFIAPEQVRCQPVTVRTDIFNFGATMYWTVARHTIPTLFTVTQSENSFLVDERIQTPREIDKTVPEPLSNLIMECIRTNPAKRPADMSELARRLEVVAYAIAQRGAAVA